MAVMVGALFVRSPVPPTPTPSPATIIKASDKPRTFLDAGPTPTPALPPPDLSTYSDIVGGHSKVPDILQGAEIINLRMEMLLGLDWTGLSQGIGDWPKYHGAEEMAERAIFAGAEGFAVSTAGMIGGGIGAVTFSALLTPAVGVPVGFTIYYLTVHNIANHYANPIVEKVYGEFPVFDEKMCKVR